MGGVYNEFVNPKNLAGIRILLVEDCPDNRFLFNRALCKRGADVALAQDGLEGVEMADAKDFDVVLMDIQMPEMDGYSAMERLKAKAYAKPVVALSAAGSREEYMRITQAGFKAHVTKPVDFETLVTTIHQVLKPIDSHRLNS